MNFEISVAEPLYLQSYFYWNEGNGDIKAKVPFFQRDEFNGEKHWSVGGYSGGGPTDDFYYLGFTLPYDEQDVITDTFDLAGLSIHARSLPDGGMITYEADKGMLQVYLNPIEGIARGSYQAQITLEDDTVININGHFDLKRENLKLSQTFS